MFEIRKTERGKMSGDFDKCIIELSKFFGKNWVRNKPNLVLVKNRETFDELVGEKTERWVVGTINNTMNVYLLDPLAYSKDSCYEPDQESFLMTMKHELTHCFWRLFDCRGCPLWLNEGLAVYLSGKIDGHEMDGEFSGFLDFYDSFDGANYFECGFAVRLLVEKFEKEKLLEVLRGLDLVGGEDEFYDLFERVYGFRIGYEEMNELMRKIDVSRVDSYEEVLR